MGFFDPAWRKQLQRAPTWFSDLALGFDDALTEELAKSGCPRSAFDLARSAVYGMLARNMHRVRGGWSDDAIRFTVISSDNALKLSPSSLRGRLYVLAKAFWVECLGRLAFRSDKPTYEDSELGRDGASERSAIVAKEADDVDAFIAACLLMMHQGDVYVKSIKILKSSAKIP